MTFGQDHSAARVRKKQSQRMVQVLILTLVFMVSEIAIGIYSHSLALLADAGHMLTDLGALSLSLIAIWFAGKPATSDKTYGYYRSEILAGFINGFLLLAISFFILTSAWQRLNTPTEILPLPVLAIASLGLVFNFICIRLLSKDPEQVSKSINMKAAMLEILGDAIASVGVIVSAVIVYFFHWQQADAIVSMFIALFILARTWNLLSECTNILMEGTPAHVDLQLLKNAVLEIPDVEEVHDMHVWSITSGLDAMSAHVLVKPEASSSEILNRVTQLLRERFSLNHTTIQIEQASCDEDACS